jgi:hypothetical protein
MMAGDKGREPATKKAKQSQSEPPAQNSQDNIAASDDGVAPQQPPTLDTLPNEIKNMIARQALVSP